jgi:F0F1-type ATP synthase assembly protein I
MWTAHKQKEMNTNRMNLNQPIGFWIAIGVGVGAGVGVVLDALALGVGIGVAVGALVGVLVAEMLTVAVSKKTHT